MEISQELTLLCARLKAHEACLNLIGKHSYYETAFRTGDLLALWSQRKDCMIAAPWGIYDGFDGVRRYYVLDGYGDRNKPEELEKLKGHMVVHEVDTAMIEVDSEALTARAAWVSPGHETLPDGTCFWCWTKAEGDFIFEDGEWKFWRVRYYPIFKTPYDTPWTKVHIGYKEIAASKHADRPNSDLVWEYGQPYPLHQPEPPLPYDHYDGCKFAEVAK